VAALVNRSWFRRSWIVQEYVLSYDRARIFYCGNKQFEPANIHIESETGNLFSKINRQLDFDAKTVVALRERQAPQLLQDLSVLLPSGLEDVSNQVLRSHQASRLLTIGEEVRNTLYFGFTQFFKVFALCQGYENEARKCEDSANEPSCNSHFCETITTRINPPPFLEHTLLSQLTLLRSMEATNPRDKNYSLLGPFQNPNRDFRVDSHDTDLLIIKYSESVARVYASLVHAIVVRTRRLEIFRECSRERQTACHPGSLTGLPIIFRLLEV
jgi:hypothetical protein